MRAISKRQTNAVALAKAMGRIKVFAVGIDDYDKTSPFGKLKTCSNDAKAVVECFLDVHQLNADKSSISFCTSQTAPRLPTRNLIIGELTKLAHSATEDDRVLFYFSGHGERLSVGDREDLFLVPQDAYDSVADALVPFERVQEILGGSAARQKLVILDACFSGPSVEGFKILPARISRKALLEYVQETRGVAVLSSTSSTLPSQSKSPNPKLSLFTHYLVRALHGQEPDALDEDRFLTVQKLFEYLSTVVPRMAYSYGGRQQQPTLDERATGVIVLGDFSASIINPESLDLHESPATAIEFTSTEGVHVTDILTRIQNFGRLSVQQIVYAANTAIGEYSATEFGRLVPVLRKTFKFSQGTVLVDDGTLRLPGATLSLRYEADDKRKGTVTRTLSVDQSWFETPENIVTLLQVLDITPEVMTIQLNQPIDVSSLTPGLEANQWNVISELAEEIQAEAGGARWTFTPDSISVRGFSPSELFGDDADHARAGLVGKALAVFASVVEPDSTPRLPPRLA
jgi:hypothetical protein